MEWFNRLNVWIKVLIIGGILFIFLSCCCLVGVIALPFYAQNQAEKAEKEIDKLEKDLDKKMEEIDKELESGLNDSGTEQDDQYTESGVKKVVNLRWEFKNTQGPSPENAQQTKIILVISGDLNKKIDLGTYDGTAVDMKKSGGWKVPSEAIMGAMSWWAGGGYQLVVYKTAPDELTVRLREVFEGEGEGQGPSEGNFTDLKVIDISINTSSGKVNPEVKVK